MKMQDHIWMVVAQHIYEAERDRDQIITIAVKLGTYINARFRGISAWEITS